MKTKAKEFPRPTKNQILVALALDYHWNAICYNGCLLIANNGKIRQAGSDQLYHALREGFNLTVNGHSLIRGMDRIWYWYNGQEYSSIVVGHKITLQLAKLVYKNWYSICDKLFASSSSRQDAPEWIRGLDGFMPFVAY